MFTKDSHLVKLYSRKVNEKEITFAEVPNLFNLRNEVQKLIGEDYE